MNKALEALIDQLKRLPGVGERSAQRFAYSIIKQGVYNQKEFAEVLEKLDENLHYCTQCQGFSDGGLCYICQNDKREKEIICVVENVFDIIAMEKTASYSGSYHVLHGVLSPIDGVKPEDIRIKELLDRVIDSQITEIIFALSSTLEGEATMNYIKNQLPDSITITHLARGLPNGAMLEYADEITLARALRERR